MEKDGERERDPPHPAPPPPPAPCCLTSKSQRIRVSILLQNKQRFPTESSSASSVLMNHCCVPTKVPVDHLVGVASINTSVYTIRAMNNEAVLVCKDDNVLERFLAETQGYSALAFS